MTYSSIHQYMLLFFIGLVLMFDGTSSSQYIFPPGLKEINTPVMTNGFVGGPTDFSVTANVSLQIPGCESYSAAGMIVVIPIGHCGREHQFSKESGAAGVIFSDYDVPGVIGRRSRVPLSNEPLTIPVVIMSGPDYYKLRDMIVNQTVPYVTIQITPGVSQWHQNVGYTAWFITLNIVFGLFYIALLALVIYKFIRKVRCTGFVLNISFVYLGLQAVFCIMMIVRWMDPLLTWGIISSMADAFIDTWPATWSFAALILMAFFWFEVINQFADTKVQAFLSKKMQIPFWILVGVIILLPAINAILLSFVTIRNLFFALLGISLGAGMLVACFYIIVAVKALQVIKRSERLNVDKKSRVRGLMRSRVSIIISAIIACIYPPCNFVLRYYIIGGNMFFGLAALYEESVLLGLIMFIQVWFMPEKSPGMSSTSKGSQSMNSMKHIKDNTNVTSTNSTVEV